MSGEQKPEKSIQRVQPFKSDYNCRLLRHKIGNLKELINSKTKDIAEFTKLTDSKLVDVLIIKNSNDSLKKVVQNKLHNLEREKNSLDKVQKEVWSERKLYEDEFNEYNNKSQQKELEESVMAVAKTNKEICTRNKENKHEYIKLRGEINVLEFYVDCSSKKITQMKKLLEEFISEKQRRLKDNLNKP